MVQDEVVVNNLVEGLVENQIRVCNYRDVKQYVSVVDEAGTQKVRIADTVMRKALLSLQEKEAQKWLSTADKTPEATKAFAKSQKSLLKAIQLPDASEKKTKAVKAVVAPLSAPNLTGLDQRLLQFATASATHQQDRRVVQSFAPDTVVNTVRFEATSADSHVVIPKPSQFADYFARMLAKDRGSSGSPGRGVAIPKTKPTNFDHIGTQRSWILMSNLCHL